MQINISIFLFNFSAATSKKKRRVKLIVDFHTDIDFKLGKLRVGGRGMFSAGEQTGEVDNIVDTGLPDRFTRTRRHLEDRFTVRPSIMSKIKTTE